MDPHRAFHRRFLNKRQDLGGVIQSLPSTTLTPSPATTSAASQNTGDPFHAFSSLIGVLTSAVLPSLGPSPTTSNTLLTPSSSSSTGSTTTPTAPAHTTTSTSSTISTNTSAAPTPKPTSTPSGVDTIYSSTDGTSVVYLTSTLPSPSATTPPHSSFLQNPSMEGGVFALVGIVVLVVAFIVVTWTLRKRRRARLEKDLAAAVTFDPGATDLYEPQEVPIEKRRLRLSGSSSGHGHGYGYGMQVQPAYAPPQDYQQGPSMGYGRYPAVVYTTPPPNLAAYRAPSPTIPQATAQGGANLTRKFSDRKPVPPLLPTPTHDPSNAHVSIPPQFYQP